MDLDGWAEEAKKHPKVTVIKVSDEEGLRNCLNCAVENAGYDYIARFDDEDYYAPAYLEDTMNAFHYSEADIVGKRTYYSYIENKKALAIRFPRQEHCFVNLVAGPTLVIRRNVCLKLGFPSGEVTGWDVQFLKDCSINGFKIYSAARFNYMTSRNTAEDLPDWNGSEKEQLSISQLAHGYEDPVGHVSC
jgi:hypothetical protein